MIKFKTNFSFGISLERTRKAVPEVSRTISKVLVVAKEVIQKRLLKS